MYLSHSCRPRPVFFQNAAQLVRCLTGSASTPTPEKESRGVPLATDLGGISLDNSKSAASGDKRRGYVPNLKDIGHSPEHIDRLLSVRLHRRLSPTLRTGPGPNRSPGGSAPRRNPTDRRPQQQQQRTADNGAPRQRTVDGGAPRASFSRRNMGPGMARGPGTGRQGGGAGGGPRPQRRGPRSATSRFRDEKAEPEVPVPPALIPSRVYDLTNFVTLAAPTRSVVRDTQQDQPTDIVQRVRETIGGDYSRWMSKEDVAAAGKDDEVSPMARARLALAFNSSVSPKDRKKLLDTAEMLLNKGKTVSVPAPAS